MRFVFLCFLNNVSAGSVFVRSVMDSGVRTCTRFNAGNVCSPEMLKQEAEVKLKDGSYCERSNSENVWRSVQPTKEFWVTAEQVAELKESLISNSVKRNDLPSFALPIRGGSGKGKKGFVDTCGSCSLPKFSMGFCDKGLRSSVFFSGMSDVSNEFDGKDAFLKSILKKQLDKDRMEKSFVQRAKHVSFAVRC